MAAMNTGLTIRPFQPEDQAAVKSLILAGLRERWKILDPSKNPDLDDIASSYADGWFRVAVIGGEIVGTGALIPRGEGILEIRRMSVARGLRRRGIGGEILRRLIEDARAFRLPHGDPRDHLHLAGRGRLLPQARLPGHARAGRRYVLPSGAKSRSVFCGINAGESDC